MQHSFRAARPFFKYPLEYERYIQFFKTETRKTDDACENKMNIKLNFCKKTYSQKLTW